MTDFTPVHPLPPAAANGHALPVDWQGVSSEVLHRLELGYQEIARRDSQAEARTARSEREKRWLYGVIGVLVVALVVLVFLQHQVKAFVQTVQVTEEGRLVQLGVPHALYDYTPPDGVYMEMVAQWVRWTRWRGDDDRMTKVQWAWVYRHTCGMAHKWLKALEEKEKPFQASPKRVAVEVKSVTKIAEPMGYAVLWEESQTEKHSPTVKTQHWIGTFTVGRMAVTRMEDILENRLGICINAYELSPQG